MLNTGHRRAPQKYTATYRQQPKYRRDVCSRKKSKKEASSCRWRHWERRRTETCVSNRSSQPLYPSSLQLNTHTTHSELLSIPVIVPVYLLWCVWVLSILEPSCIDGRGPAAPRSFPAGALRLFLFLLCSWFDNVSAGFLPCAVQCESRSTNKTDCCKISLSGKTLLCSMIMYNYVFQSH